MPAVFCFYAAVCRTSSYDLAIPGQQGQSCDMYLSDGGFGFMLTVLFGSRGSWMRHFSSLSLLLLLLTGCAEEFMVLHSQTGEPLIISRRAYTSNGCFEKLREDAARMDVSFRYVHVRGSTVGTSLLWPFEPGYACEAAIGPEEPQSGTYPIVPHLLSPRLTHSLN
jgi:hypothetical protein